MRNLDADQSPKEFKSFYKNVSGGEGMRCHYPERLDTYGCGCQHDCSYCYAKSLLAFRKLWNSDEPRVADIRKVRRKIAAFEPGRVVRLGGMTDCFQQPHEMIHRVTYKAIEAMNERGVHYLIVTKSHLVASDDYLAVMDKRLAHIQMSISATDDEWARRFEKAPAPSRRIAAIEKLQLHGFDAHLRLSPFIGDAVDYDVLNHVECDKLLIEFLRVNHWIRKWLPIDLSRYSLKDGGYLHLPLSEKCRMLEGITGFSQLSVCDDVNDHYDYWGKQVNANPEDCCNLRMG